MIVPSIARQDIHGLFDQHKWLLLPEDDIIDTFYDSINSVGGEGHARRGSFPELPVRLLYHNLT